MHISRHRSCSVGRARVRALTALSRRHARVLRSVVLPEPDGPCAECGEARGSGHEAKASAPRRPLDAGPSQHRIWLSLAQTTLSVLLGVVVCAQSMHALRETHHDSVQALSDASGDVVQKDLPGNAHGDGKILRAWTPTKKHSPSSA